MSREGDSAALVWPPSPSKIAIYPIKQDKLETSPLGKKKISLPVKYKF